ncbi:MAG: acyl-CoA thioesterase [Deltaproteobacteria bacterium]|nr:acyl-CoA thioesterase [Deltaproteobacteria bacterium]
MRVFRTEFQVRGYELDGYGHVNHAVYLNYAEHARWQMIEEAAGGADYFKRHGVAPVIVRAEVDYREPCFLAEWIVVETTLFEFRKRVAKYRQLVKKRDSGRVAAELLMTVLVVDAGGKAVSLPADFEAMYK